MQREHSQFKSILCFAVILLNIATQSFCSRGVAAEIASYSIAFSYEGKTLASGASFAFETSDGVILVESNDALFAVKKKAAGQPAMPETLLVFDKQNPVYLGCVAGQERKPLSFMTHGNGQAHIQFYDPPTKQLATVLLPSKPEIEPKTLAAFGDQEAVTIDAFTGQLLFFSPKSKTFAFVDKRQEAHLVHPGHTTIDPTGKKLFCSLLSSHFGILDISTKATPKLLWVKKYSKEKDYPYTPYQATFSDDGKYVVFVTYNNQLVLIRAADGEMLDQLELSRLGEIPDCTYLRMIDSKLCIGVNTQSLKQPRNFPQGILPKDPAEFNSGVCGVFAVNVENDKLVYKNGKRFDRVLSTATYSTNCYCVLGNEIMQIPHKELHELVSQKKEPAAK